MFRNTPFALMKFVAKAALNVAGFGVAGDLAVEVLPDVARDVWEWWGKNKNPGELQAEVKEVAQLSPADARQQAEQIVAAEAAGQPKDVQKALTAYLAQVPAAIRQSQRCPADPSGRTLLLGLSLAKSDDVLSLLPARMPRYQPGDRPGGIGDWELEELLGVGGFGEVWRARNPHLSDPVALKFCLDPSAAQWLRHEAALLGRVMSQGRHPGIVPLLDTYLNGDPPCLKYEYVAGGDLSGLIGQWRQAPPRDHVAECTRLIHELAGIVAFAHQLHPPIVHRDLKPANILLQPSGDGAVRARVADFGIGGIAVRQAREQTTRGMTRGAFLATALRGACTPLYASPQQQRGEDPDPRDDVYALGVIWYQMLTGDLLTGASADWREELEDRGAGDEVLRLLGSCLAAKAEKRPASAAILAEELARLQPAACSPPMSATQPEPPPLIAMLPPLIPAPPPAPTVLTPQPRRIVQPSRSLPKQLTNLIGMKFVLVPAGTFVIGSPPDEAGRSADEGPQHEVTITRPFYLASYPVTQAQYQRVMRSNPSHFCRSGRGKELCKDIDPQTLPVERVTWGNAVVFCRKLSEWPEERRHRRKYRLPTEAEWEYACRGDSMQPFHLGLSLSSALANFDGNYPYGGAPRGPFLKRTSPVGSYPPSALGLYDLHGNVWEWCADWYGEHYYAESPGEDPPGPATGDRRVVRGGCWSSPGNNCRTAYRGKLEPGDHLYRVGFRVLLET
ncbi:MAG TPA: bifunctional serine/threonine-protein kinase/formylglycine-generating enzyme family protein [Gemmataceae bacterium]|nr:bifunctional serine/threonine-protein kinase/formylglycine-generating enzyme family protein [Gemmataceae bacterium]